MPRLATLQALRQCRVYDLAQEMFAGMPVIATLPPYTMTLVSWHGERIWKDGYMGSDEFITMCNHTGTHLDALCHGSSGGQFFDGTPVVQTRAGFRVHSIETVAPIVRRGVLLDVATTRGVDVLPPPYEVTVQDLADTCVLQGTSIESGDVVLIRTGWMRNWDDTQRYVGLGQPPGMPGPGLAAARWLADHEIWGGGSDTLAFEVFVPPVETVPVHRHFLAERGVFILEALNLEDLARDRVYEFLFVGAPIKFRGGTGAPIRPMVFA